MESSSKCLDHLEAALRALAAWFGASQIPAMVIGGVAVALQGQPRMTGDVDGVVFLEESEWPDFLDQAKQFGFVSRISDPLPFAAQARVLLLVHQPSQVTVDISLGALEFERDALSRAIQVQVFDFTVPVATAEDLIVMKAIARRSRDIADIESLLSMGKTLDIARIRHWVQTLSDIMEVPDIYTNLNEILKKQDPKPARKKRGKK